MNKHHAHNVERKRLRLKLKHYRKLSKPNQIDISESALLKNTQARINYFKNLAHEKWMKV